MYNQWWGEPRWEPKTYLPNAQVLNSVKLSMTYVKVSPLANSSKNVSVSFLGSLSYRLSLSTHVLCGTAEETTHNSDKQTFGIWAKHARQSIDNKLHCTMEKAYKKSHEFRLHFRTWLIIAFLYTNMLYLSVRIRDIFLGRLNNGINGLLFSCKASWFLEVSPQLLCAMR